MLVAVARRFSTGRSRGVLFTLLLGPLAGALSLATVGRSDREFAPKRFSLVPVRAIDFDCDYQLATSITVGLDDTGRVRIARVQRRLPASGSVRGPQGLPFDTGDQLRSSGRWVVAEAEGGWLVGLDNGEFGGGLWWFSSSVQPAVRLNSDRVTAILPAPDSPGVLVIGSRLYDSSYARVISYAGQWKPDSELTIEGEALFAVRYTDSVLVLTSRRVASLTAASLDTATIPELSPALRPFSVVRGPSGTFYVGMARYAIAAVPGSPPATYVADECRQQKCACTSPPGGDDASSSARPPLTPGQPGTLDGEEQQEGRRLRTGAQ